MKVTVLSGGVGGARFLRGLLDVVDPAELTVIGNVGDDLEILGLHVSPDLDSILYALAGLSDEERGWGRAERELARARVGSRVRRCGLVPARRPRSRPAPRAHGAAPRRHAALRGHRAARRARGPRADAAPRHRRRAANLARHAGGQLPLPGVVRRARASRRGRRRSLRRRGRRHARAGQRWKRFATPS